MQQMCTGCGAGDTLDAAECYECGADVPACPVCLDEAAQVGLTFTCPPCFDRAHEDCH